MSHTRWTRITCSVLVLAVNLAACVSQQALPQTGTQAPRAYLLAELANTHWTLITLNGDRPVEGSEIKLSLYPDNYLEGYAGCNYFGVDYRVDGNQFQVPLIHRTRENCTAAKIMQQEAAFFEALEKAVTYRAAEEGLEFDDAAGNTLLVFARKLPASVDPAIQDSEWLLKSIYGSELVTGSRITLNMTAEGFQGFSGCNNYGGKFEAANQGAIKFSEIAVTLQLCQEPPGVIDQEELYIKALASVAVYSLIDDRLELIDAGGATILIYDRQRQTDMVPADLIGTNWLMVSMDERLSIEGSTITLAFLDSQWMIGHAGCRDYIAAYQPAGDRLGMHFISMLGPDCSSGAYLEQEGQYTTMLETTERYLLEQDRLEITTLRGEALIYAPLPEQASAPLEGTIWSLTALIEPNPVEGMPVPLPAAKEIHSGTEITLALEGQRASGVGECSAYEAAYVRDRDRLAFEPIAVTRQDCLASPGVVVQEQRYLDILQSVSGYRIVGDLLWMLAGESYALVYRVKIP